MSMDPGLAAQLAQLNAAFAAGLPKRLSDIEAAMQAFMREPGDRSHLESLHTLLHSLAGSAGTFGFDELGKCARRFEHHCDPWLEGKAIDRHELAQLAERFATLGRSIESQHTL
jgi:HPt (histidine-containing phosphotransfer) domain-containing protein